MSIASVFCKCLNYLKRVCCCCYSTYQNYDGLGHSIPLNILESELDLDYSEYSDNKPIDPTDTITIIVDLEDNLNNEGARTVVLEENITGGYI